MSETDDQIHLELWTKHSHDTFLKADAFVNESGNVCLYLDEKNFAEMSPLMAKRLSKRLEEASRDALTKLISE